MRDLQLVELVGLVEVEFIGMATFRGSVRFDQGFGELADEDILLPDIFDDHID